MLAVIFFLSKNLSDKKRDMEVDLWENNPEVILSLMMGFSWGVFIYSNSYRVIFCLSILSDLCYIKNIFWQDVNPCRWLRMVLSYQSNSSFKKKKKLSVSTFSPEYLFLLDQHLLFEDYILNSHPFLSSLFTCRLTVWVGGDDIG